MPEWPKGADCKSAGSAYPGSNPGAATERETPADLLTQQISGGFCMLRTRAGEGAAMRGLSHLMQCQRAPPCLRQVALLATKGGCFGRPHGRVVQAPEERIQVHAARPLLAHSLEQRANLAGLATLSGSASSADFGAAHLTVVSGFTGVVKYCSSTASPNTSLRQARLRRAVRGAAGFPSTFSPRASSATRTVAASSRAATGRSSRRGDPPGVAREHPPAEEPRLRCARRSPL